MKQALFFLLLLLPPLYGFSQVSDVDLIRQKHDSTTSSLKKRKYTTLASEKHHSALHKYNPVTLTFSGLMYFYQNILSSQIYAGCLYSPSCSEFSKKSIKEYGLIKGVFLSADRLSRCNRISALEYDLSTLRGRIGDDPHLYRLK
jgi:putative component of membrane protein insertase Oxa1/YidC/SpoIIIJ protein YidD